MTKQNKYHENKTTWNKNYIDLVTKKDKVVECHDHSRPEGHGTQTTQNIMKF